MDELCSPGPNGEPKIGRYDPLVDAEGFPRADIDIYNAKNKRHRLAVINTDYRNLMKDIEKEVSKHFENKNEYSTTPSFTSMPVVHAESLKAIYNESDLLPIAKIDQILQDSPAGVSGLLEGDTLISFGHITKGDQNILSQISQLVGQSINSSITIKILRGGSVVSIKLVPKAWGGRGLLGCHLTPI